MKLMGYLQDGILGTALLILIPLHLMNIPIIIRRLHDIGLGAVHALLLLIPAYNVLLYIIILLRESEKGINNFGSNPLEEGSQGSFIDINAKFFSKMRLFLKEKVWNKALYPAIVKPMYFAFSEKTGGVAPRYKIMFIVILFLALIPQLFGVVTVTVVMDINVFLIYVAAWDLLSGYTGQESFGHSLFIGLSAYFSGFLAFRFAEMGILNVHLPFIVNIFIGGFIAALFGLIIGIPSLKLKGPFLALATLASAVLGHELVMTMSKFTHGEEGLSSHKHLYFPEETAYYISIALVIVLVGVCYFISRSKYGTLLKAIREDDSAAKAIGINTVKFRVGIFVLSAAIAGMAGSFHAYKVGVVSPSIIDTALSLEIITFAVVGGISTIVGPMGGAVILFLMGDFIRNEAPEYKIIIYMAFLVIVMILNPKGIWASIVDRVKLSYENWKGGK